MKATETNDTEIKEIMQTLMNEGSPILLAPARRQIQD